ncbi:MAG: phosphoenolpyruvate synthase, partial [Syntrophales bacterium LBB04]|nr:phosphoenolpyruvate synthase [Syntrophales bacterium LBB04]
MKSLIRASTGIASFDEVIDSLRTGDNVVWQVDDIEDYASFVTFFVDRALAEGKRINYMRFAEHRQLVGPDPGINIHQLDARSGFEPFSAQVHGIATEEGEGVYYVFDSLSDLLSAWATDLMIGNFFRITCPYLFRLNTIAYFGLLRNSHSFKTAARIRETTQVLLDVNNNDSGLYGHPP